MINKIDVNLTFWRVAAFMFPIVYFYPYTIGNSDIIALGLDFFDWSYVYTAVHIDYLSKGELLMWSPSEAGGHPFWSNPFPQTFYPLTIPLAFCYKFFGGYCYSDHIKYLILGHALFSLGLFSWLNCLQFKKITSFTCAVIIGISFSLTEPSRFVISIHTIAWYPFILWGITLLLGHKKKLSGFIIILVSFYCLLTSGYSNYIYYFIFLIPMYVLLFFFQRTSRLFLNNANNSFDLKNIFLTGLSFLIPLIVTYPYFLKLAQAMSMSSGRSGDSWTYSTAAMKYANWSEYFAGFVFPPGVFPNGWVYFGFLGIYVILAGFIICLLQKKIRKELLSTYLFLFSWIFIVTTLGLPEIAIHFKPLWENIPFFANLKGWMRISIIMMPIWGFLLATSIELIVNIKFSKYLLIRTYVALIAFFLIIINFQLKIPLHKWTEKNYLKAGYEGDFENFLSHFVTYNQYAVVFLFVGLFLLFFIKNKGDDFKSTFLINSICISVLLFTITDVQHNGIKIWSNKFVHFKKKYKDREIYDFSSKLENQFYEKKFDSKWGSLNLDAKYTFNTVNMHFRNTSKLFELSKKDKEGILRTDILGEKNNGKLFLSSFIPKKISELNLFKQDNIITEQNNQYDIKYLSNDRIEIIVNLEKECFLSLLDNWDPDWIVEIDGKLSSYDLFLNTFKSVKIPSGKHKIMFAYRPFSNVFNVKNIFDEIKAYKQLTIE